VIELGTHDELMALAGRYRTCSICRRSAQHSWRGGGHGRMTSSPNRERAIEPLPPALSVDVAAVQAGYSPTSRA